MYTIFEKTHFEKLLFNRIKKKGEKLFVIVKSNFELIGFMEVLIIKKSFYEINSIKVKKSFDFKSIGVELIEYLKNNFPDIILIAKTNTKKMDDLLIKTDFKMYIERQYFQKKLLNYNSPYEDHFLYEEFSEAKKAIFSETLNKTEIGLSIEEMRCYIGEKFNPNYWKLAYLDGEIVGMVLPYIMKENDKKGGIIYIGLVPKFREQGFGKIIHAKGLKILAEANVELYEGSTESKNTYMLKVFSKNHCTKNKITREYMYKKHI